MVNNKINDEKLEVVDATNNAVLVVFIIDFLNDRFIKVSSLRIYEHTVAQKFTSQLQMPEFRAGVVLKGM
jgi:hypothetical protein